MKSFRIVVERCQFVPENRQRLLRILRLECFEKLLLPNDELDGLLIKVSGILEAERWTYDEIDDIFGRQFDQESLHDVPATGEYCSTQLRDGRGLESETRFSLQRIECVAVQQDSLANRFVETVR